MQTRCNHVPRIALLSFRWSQRCTTSTLTLLGADDRCTPLSQAQGLFTAIAETGTEGELVVYQREGHVPVERAHALDAITRTQAWFDAHL